MQWHLVYRHKRSLLHDTVTRSRHVAVLPRTSTSGLFSPCQAGGRAAPRREAEGVCWENVGWGGEGRGAREEVSVLQRVGGAVCHPGVGTSCRRVMQGVLSSFSMPTRVFQRLKICTEQKF